MPLVNVPQIFAAMPGRYKKGSTATPKSFYFSIGEHRYTVKVAGDSCVVEDGKTVENADVVLKTTEDLFQKMVVQGKLPGAIDIAMGRIKTNDPMGLQKLREWFDFSGI